MHPPHPFNYSDNQYIHSSSSESFRSIDNQHYPGNLDEESNQDSGEGCEDIADSLAPVGSNEGLGGDAIASADATASMQHLHMLPKTLCSADERPQVDELEGREPRWVGASSQPISQPQPLSKGLNGRCGISAMPSGGATLVPSSFSDHSPCVPCSSFVGPIFLVDPNGDIIRLGELQETHIDVEVEPANQPVEDCNVGREFFIPVTDDYVGFRGGVGGTGWDPSYQTKR